MLIIKAVTFCQHLFGCNYISLSIELYFHRTGERTVMLKFFYCLHDDNELWCSIEVGRMKQRRDCFVH